jgi:hypothetical protein
MPEPAWKTPLCAQTGLVTNALQDQEVRGNVYNLDNSYKSN